MLRLPIKNAVMWDNVVWVDVRDYVLIETPMGVAIRGVISITAKMEPQKQKLGYNGSGIRGGKMPSKVFG